MGAHACNHCGYTSTRKYNLQVHIRNKHGNNAAASTNSTTHIPIEKYKEVVDEMHKWKFENEKWGEAYRLLEEHRMEDGEHSLAIITYLQNVLNANNIRYNLDLA